MNIFLSGDMKGVKETCESKKDWKGEISNVARARCESDLSGWEHAKSQRGTEGKSSG